MKKQNQSIYQLKKREHEGKNRKMDERMKKENV